VSSGVRTFTAGFRFETLDGILTVPRRGATIGARGIWIERVDGRTLQPANSLSVRPSTNWLAPALDDRRSSDTTLSHRQSLARQRGQPLRAALPRSALTCSGSNSWGGASPPRRHCYSPAPSRPLPLLSATLRPAATLAAVTSAVNWSHPRPAERGQRAYQHCIGACSRQNQTLTRRVGSSQASAQNATATLIARKIRDLMWGGAIRGESGLDGAAGARS
jgi:hypothetical protein